MHLPITHIQTAQNFRGRNRKFSPEKSLIPRLRPKPRIKASIIQEKLTSCQTGNKVAQAEPLIQKIIMEMCCFPIILSVRLCSKKTVLVTVNKKNKNKN